MTDLPRDWPEWTRRARCGGDTRGYEWMPTEDAIVLTIVCAKAAAREMPWRTWRACQQRRHRLLRVLPNRCQHRRTRDDA